MNFCDRPILMFFSGNVFLQFSIIFPIQSLDIIPWASYCHSCGAAREDSSSQLCGSIGTLHWQPGYLKALERGNSVPRPKGFCEPIKVNFSAVLSQNLNCCNLCAINTLMF